MPVFVHGLDGLGTLWERICAGSHPRCNRAFPQKPVDGRACACACGARRYDGEMALKVFWEQGLLVVDLIDWDVDLKKTSVEALANPNVRPGVRHFEP